MKLRTKVFVGALLATGISSGAFADSILNLGVPVGTYGETQPVTTSGTINNAQYYVGDQQPAGSGVLDSFLRIQAQNSNQTFEQGYNTDNGTPLDDKGGAFTHSIQLSDLHTTWIGGVSYYGFVLDINQTNVAPGEYISMDSLKIFQASSGNLNNFDTSTDLFPTSSATLIYDMAGAGGYRVDLNYTVSSGGSGIADMFVYIPTADFLASPSYVYLYSSFGGNGTIPPYQANSGYEEWATASGVGTPPGGGGGQGVPLPSTATSATALLALTAMATVGWRRRQTA